MKKYGVIYRITNLKSGKIYIGSTIAGIKKRYSQHWTDVKGGCTNILHNAMRSYGKESFKIEEICTVLVDEQNLWDLEDHFIDTLSSMNPSGYNMVYAHRGVGSRRFISILSTERWAQDGYKERMTPIFIAAAEHRMNPIVSVSIYSGDVRFFSSMAEAEREGYYRSNIRDCFKGKTATAFRFCWFEKVTDDEQYYKDETIKLMGKFKTEFTVPIIRTCRKTGATKTYANVKEAGLDGFPVKAVNPVLKKTAKTPHFRGFDWNYL